MGDPDGAHIKAWFEHNRELGMLLARRWTSSRANPQTHPLPSTSASASCVRITTRSGRPIDGAANDDRQSNARLGLTLALSVSRHHSIKLYGSKAVATRIGGDFDIVGLVLQYRWGGGL
jgi:hypothetical protein